VDLLRRTEMPLKSNKGWFPTVFGPRRSPAGVPLPNFEFPPNVRIASPWETLEACRERIEKQMTGVYLRFGDGEINVLEGGNTIAEKGTPAFAAEMKQVFSMGGPGVLKSLPLHSRRFGLWPGMKPGVHENPDDWAESMLARTYPFFVGERIYSHVALCYLAVFDRACAVNFLTFLKRTRPLFVGNRDISEDVLRGLFGEFGRVGAPPRDSYREIDRILQETRSRIRANGAAFQVVVMAMGCAGRVVAKRILADNSLRVFFFDLGSIMDAFNQNTTRAWMEHPHAYWKELLREIANVQS